MRKGPRGTHCGNLGAAELVSEMFCQRRSDCQNRLLQRNYRRPRSPQPHGVSFGFSYDIYAARFAVARRLHP
jgi:hypothetical protein